MPDKKKHADSVYSEDEAEQQDRYGDFEEQALAEGAAERAGHRRQLLYRPGNDVADELADLSKRGWEGDASDQRDFGDDLIVADENVQRLRYPRPDSLQHL
jgi:hypothetical protein